jgi:putative PIN family toxin of toxin-antitoxin system
VVLAEHELVIGEVIVNELRRTLERKLKLPADRLAGVELLLSQLDVIPKPAKPSSAPVRDPSDRWILATAVAGDADVLITGDQDLLSVCAELPVRVLDPRSFWHLLRE